ncbi:MAG: hypothetical protein P1V97_28920 [Planctomycetota bacterium]|nr:hypothetical protein [Planctomycetota bacterium]
MNMLGAALSVSAFADAGCVDTGVFTEVDFEAIFDLLLKLEESAWELFFEGPRGIEVTIENGEQLVGEFNRSF